jgi:protocatechuate 3,4-dioxygenase beta subunit
MACLVVAAGLLACDPGLAPSGTSASSAVQRTEEFQGQITDGTAASLSPYEWRGIPGVTVEMAVWQQPARVRSGDTLAYPTATNANYQVIARTISDAKGNFKFRVLVPGNYGFRAIPPANSGFLATTFPQGHQHLATNQTAFGIRLILERSGE